METRATRPTRHPPLWPLPVAIAFACLPLCGHAADAHRAVQAKPGDMVLLRNVPARPAARAAPPGMALMASPSPRPEILASLGTGELSDEDIARMDASPSPAARLQSTAVGRALGGMLVDGRGGGTVGGRGVAPTLSAPASAIGDATSGIGDRVQGALARLPLGNGH